MKTTKIILISSAILILTGCTQPVEESKKITQKINLCLDGKDCKKVEVILDNEKITELTTDSGSNLKVTSSNWNNEQGWLIDELGNEWEIYSDDYLKELEKYNLTSNISNESLDYSDWIDGKELSDLGVEYKIPKELINMTEEGNLPIKYVLIDELAGGGVFDIYLAVGDEEDYWNPEIAEENCLQEKKLNKNVECLRNDTEKFIYSWIPDKDTDPSGNPRTVGVYLTIKEPIIVTIAYGGSNTIKAKDTLFQIGQSIKIDPAK